MSTYFGIINPFYYTHIHNMYVSSVATHFKEITHFEKKFNCVKFVTKSTPFGTFFQSALGRYIHIFNIETLKAL